MAAAVSSGWASHQVTSAWTTPVHTAVSAVASRSVCAPRAARKRSDPLAAMAASRHNPTLRDAYLRLRAAGKKPIVAITALMRRLIVIANARLRDAYAQTAAN